MTKRKNAEDRERAKTPDDILGISHGGGRDQYGGLAGGGQSGGGPYANPHSVRGDEPEGNPFGPGPGIHKTGGQTNQAYYGGGQMGDRNYSDHDHNAASAAGGPEVGPAATPLPPVQPEDLQHHQGFGAEHRGQREQGRKHGGPHIEPDPEPGRRG